MEAKDLVIDIYYLGLMERYLNYNNIPYNVEYPPKWCGSNMVKLTISGSREEFHKVAEYYLAQENEW